MKTLIALCLVSFAVEVAAFGQGSPAQPPASPFPSASVAATASASVSPADDLAGRIHQRIEKKLKGRHGITIDTDGSSRSGSEDFPEALIPVVGIVFLTIFGAPVVIVIALIYFGSSKNRMMHRTIRMMVEKGQPVPAALLAPPTPAIRQRSDMRRGVVLSMIGIGLMVWLGAVNDWEGGAWSLGLIPFLIGAGYLLVWKLEGGQKEKADNPPPLP
jgi:hypothetical protein